MRRSPSDTFQKIIDARHKLAALLTKVEPSIPYIRAKTLVNTNTSLKPVNQIIMSMKQIEQTHPYTEGAIKIYEYLYEYLAKQLLACLYHAPFIHKPSYLVQEDLKLRFVTNLIREELHRRNKLIDGLKNEAPHTY